MMDREKQIEKTIEFLNNKINIERNSYFGKGCITIPLIEAEKILDILKGYRKQSEGEWIYHECVSSYDGAKSGYSCSVCSAFVDEEFFETDEFHKKHCGNCGAKMSGTVREMNKLTLAQYYEYKLKRWESERSKFRERNKEIIALRNEGKTLEEIGEIYGISKQRVFAIVGKCEKGGTK